MLTLSELYQFLKYWFCHPLSPRMHPESRHELALQAVRRDTGRKSGVKSKGSRSAIQTSHNDEENSGMPLSVYVSTSLIDSQCLCFTVTVKHL